MNRIAKHLRTQSVKLGMLSALIGCMAFVLIEEARIIYKFGFGGKADIEFSILIFIFGSIFAFIPTSLASIVLVSILYRDALNNILSTSKAFQKGALMGALTGILLFILGVIVTNSRGSPIIYLIYAVEVTVIASLAGGWTGIKLARYIVYRQD